MTELAKPADARGQSPGASTASGGSGGSSPQASTASGGSGGSSPQASTAPRPVRDGVLLGLAVGVSGLAFGAAAVSAGLTVWQACALSLLAYTGASQFALAGTIAAGGSLVAGAPAATLPRRRDSLYSLRLSRLLHV